MIFISILQAIVAARKFTDPKVSVKERMRALSGCSSEVTKDARTLYEIFCPLINFVSSGRSSNKTRPQAPRFVAETTIGKAATTR